MKTRAALLVELRHPLEIAEIEIPALAPGQVLVKVERSGICGAQLNEIDGMKGPDKFLPHLLGHEAVGDVVEVGPGVTKVRAGDPVVMHWKVGAGIQASTPKYRWGERTVNAGWVTTFNDVSIASENRLTVLPAGANRATAPLYGCALTTAFGVISNDARLKLGESVAVIGCGGVGLPCVIAAVQGGAYPVIAVDRVQEKLEMARRYGATHTILTDGPDLEEAIRAIVPHGVDVAIDNVGRSSIIQAAYRATAPKGRVIMVGVPRHDDPITIDSLPLHFGKVLTGSFGGDTYPTDDIPRYVRMEMAGRFDLSTLISHVFPLEKVNEAIELMRGGGAHRIQLSMQ